MLKDQRIKFIILVNSEFPLTMSNQKNANLLETVIEELDADRTNGNVSHQRFLKPIKSAKVRKSKTCKMKKPKSDKNASENKSKEMKQELIVEVPNSEKGENQNEQKSEVPEINKDAHSHDKNTLATETLSKTEYMPLLNHASETDIDKNNGKNTVSDEANVQCDIKTDKLFTRVFSLPNKETLTSKNDIIITPTVGADHEHVKVKGESNKENQLNKEYSTRSQDFIRSSSDKSILTTKSEPRVSRPPKEFSKRRRPMSTSALSKKVLEAYLPRKSFFSSHDKVLRDAGFQVDDAMKNKKRPNWKLILRMHTEEELNPDFGSTEEDKTAASDPQVKEESDDDTEDTPNLMDAVETLISQGKDSQLSKRKLKAAAKKLALEDKSEYKPLLEYLKYINEHPEEYMNMTRYSSKNTDYKHPSVMVRMARVYRKAHHGTARNNIFTHALAGLKPKLAEATSQRHGRGEQFGTNKKDQTEAPQEQTSVSQDEGKSEIEKLKIKTEKWMGGLTTMQTLKAKEFALKDLGEEDITVTKWWLAFKSCHYLRIPPTVLEQAQ